MLDYWTLLKMKLNDIKTRAEELEEEQDRLLTALSVLEEINLEHHTDDPSPGQKPLLPAGDAGTMIDAILRNLQSSLVMMTGRELHRKLASEREVSRGAVYTALKRLQQRGKTFKVDQNWGLVGHHDRTRLLESSKE